MDYFLVALEYLAYITAVGLPASLIAILVGVILDIKNKKFHWSKLALIFFVIVVILMIILIRLTYYVTSNFN